MSIALGWSYSYSKSNAWGKTQWKPRLKPKPVGHKNRWSENIEKLCGSIKWVELPEDRADWIGEIMADDGGEETLFP